MTRGSDEECIAQAEHCKLGAIGCRPMYSVVAMLTRRVHDRHNI